jgi:hypothetical protein
MQRLREERSVTKASVVITSGESNNELSSDDDRGHDHWMESTVEDLYDDTADQNDERYVRNNLRSGITEFVSSFDDNETADNRQSHPASRLKDLKPRNSDAVLSCPCCFNIVCLDCQQHERFADQFRAMFVLNVVVHWESKLFYDEQHKCLRSLDDIPTSAMIEHQIFPMSPDKSCCYFSVCCAICQTQVAVIDMSDEVYHFFGCLASA